MEPIIGDASLNGWGTFFVYLATAWLCAANAHRSFALIDTGVRRVATAQARRRFWTALAVLLLLLGLTRLLDLQALVANMMRTLLRNEDVYSDRAGLQFGLVAMVASFGTIGVLIALVSLRRLEGAVLAAMVGAASLAIFTAIRTISLHDVDHLLNRSLGVPHFQVNNLIEIGLLGWIAISGYAFSRSLSDEGENARLRALKIQERRRLLSEKRRFSQS